MARSGQSSKESRNRTAAAAYEEGRPVSDEGQARVDCKDIKEAARRGEKLSGPDLDAHLASCAACAEIVAAPPAFVRALGAMDPDGPAPSFEGLARALTRERGVGAWLRSRPTWARFALALAAAFACGFAVLSLGHGLRGDLARYPSSRLALSLGLLIGLGVSSLWAALRPVHVAPLPRSALFALLTAATLAVLLLSGVPPAHARDPAALAAHDPSARACFFTGALLGQPFLAVALVASRLRSALELALAAAAAGLLGNVVLELGCPSTDQMHLLEGHAPIVPALVTLAALFARATFSR
jgi:hypothetical protein